MTHTTDKQTRFDFDEVPPNASAMAESMRAHGYTLASAIADLIDNSIAAGSRNVWTHLEWNGDDSWIAITDDGGGMTETELLDAMRLGTKSPLVERDAKDLGRFGLGLKTASFSQARRLTVITRPKTGKTFTRRWDLDHLAKPDVEGWQLLRSPHPDAGDRARTLDGMNLNHGTEVLLEVIDRVVGQADSQREKDREDHFLWQIERVREHLAMVFHRFLSKRKDRVRIFVNEEEIRAWDPFLEHHEATQLIGDYSQKLGSHEVPVRVTGYVLPHRDKFEIADDHRAAGGPGGWNAQQGFYLYRSKRLIIAGDWLQLRWQKEEHFKLARIRLDIPNSMDQDWQIDVKKSTAAPPAVLRPWLKGIAENVRRTAKQVYAHRGKYGAGKRKTREHRRPWVTAKRPGGEFCYRIDRKHPMLESLICSLGDSRRDTLEALLRLVEETVPVQRIWYETTENQDAVALPFAGEKSEDLRELILMCHDALVRCRGLDHASAWAILVSFDGFQGTDAQAIIGSLKEGS